MFILTHSSRAPWIGSAHSCPNSTQMGDGVLMILRLYVNSPVSWSTTNDANVFESCPPASNQFPLGSRLKLRGVAPRIFSISITDNVPSVWFTL